MGKPSIIIIDDDKIVITYCKLLLTRIFGQIDIQTFLSPEAGLEYLSVHFSPASEPVYLLLDINMPTMTGWEFLQVFDNLSDSVKNSIRVFILSSSVDGRDKERASQNKYVLDYLVKPLTKETILHITDWKDD